VTLEQMPARALPVQQETWSRALPLQSESWGRAEQIMAVLGTVLLAARIPLTQQLLTIGDLVVLASFPIWYPITRAYAAARLWLFVGAICLPAGLVLSVLNSVDHQIRIGSSATTTILMLSLLCSVGFMLWAKGHLSEGALVSSFGFGLLLGQAFARSALFETNPYKYGFALPAAIIGLGLARMSKRRGAELFIAIVLCIASTVADARSDFGILLLTAALLAWQMRPKISSRKGSAFMAVAGIGVCAVAAYNLGQALILDGFFGEETQQRTTRQIAEAGSLILGGRPEMGATLNMMRNSLLGFGSGTIPNYNDIRAAKQGMSFLGYDTSNGYVERWMFGNGYRLHSAFGDLWALYGLVGLFFAFLTLGLALRRLGTALVNRTAGGAVIFATALVAWNTFFTPLYGGLRMAILVTALALIARPLPPPDPLTRPRRRYWPT
jgi:hypothetical protein